MKKDDYYFEGKATGETAQPGIFSSRRYFIV